MAGLFGASSLLGSSIAQARQRPALRRETPFNLREPISSVRLRSIAMVERLDRDTFAPLINTDFRVTTDSMSLPMRLVELQDFGGPPSDSAPQSEGFSLRFVGPGNLGLPQQMYTFAHPQIGEFALFIVPVQQDENGVYYEAVFNRIVVPGAR
jgi:hypothetical protein